ncbi:MAG TPA: choice-of-anchor D domain-containing protein [Terriglobia bacterium]|nr:choice-of-anchor D domain-containing protein [Terriglobia bacterium]
MGRRGARGKGRGALQSLRGLIRNSLRAATLGILLSPCALFAAQAYGELPLAFEANRGQWSDQVKFVARGEGYTLFLMPAEAVLVLRKASPAPALKSETGKSKLETRNSKIETRQSKIRNPKSKIQNPMSSASSVLRLTFPEGNPNARVVGLAEQPGKTHYLIGRNPRDWRTDVPTYGRVKFEQIFPGIDLVFYAKQPKRGGESGAPGRQLEFDFVVAPGADPGAIRLAIEVGKSKLETEKSKVEKHKSQNENRQTSSNPESPTPNPVAVHVAASGDLLIAAGGGEIRFRKPIVYQENSSVVSGQLSVGPDNGRWTTEAANPNPKIPNRQFVDGRYVLRELKFKTGNSKIDNRQSQTTTPAANSPFTTHNSKFEVGFEIAPYDRTRPLVIDPVLAYSTYLGGTGLDYAEGIAVDAAGSAYVVGYTNSTDFPLSNPAQAAGGGTCGSGLDVYPCPDVFIAKLNAAGTALVYSTYIGGSGEDYGMGIAVDASGNAYVTGYTNSADFPLTDPLQSSMGGGYDAFALKLNPQGSVLVSSTYLGGGGDDYGYGIALAPGGEVLLAGFTSSPDFPTTAGAIGEAYGGGPYDAFVSRLDLAGAALVYSTYLGGSGEDFANDIAADAAGNAYVTGYTNSANFPVAGALQGTYAAGVCGAEPSTFSCYDAFVTKLSAESGTLAYSTYLGGRGSEYGYGIAVDGDGNAFVAGATTSTDFPVSARALQTAGGGVSVDAYVTKLDPSGASILYSTYLGGLGAEAALDVAADGGGNAYVTGYNLGGGFPVASPLQTAGAGHFDAFLAKLDDAGTALVFSTYLGGSGQDKGNAVAVDSSGNAYVTGGTFSTDFPVSAEAFQTVYAGGSFEGFVAKMADLGRPVGTPQEISLLFPDQGVGTTSVAQPVSFSNSGDAELLISNISASGDFAQTSDCAESVPPGGHCALEITFSPTALGPRTGSVSVEHNAAGSPFVVHLAGNGVAAPALEISPASLSFGEQSVGTTGAGQTITLRNVGDALLTFSSISTSDDFAQSNICGQSLAVDSGCSMAVTFTPLTPGTIAGAVTIVDNAPGSPHVVALNGTGLGPAVSVSPAFLVFGDQLVEATSSPQTLTLTNAGNRPLEISSITISGDFVESKDCAATLAAGSSCTLQVSFTPVARGERTGALTISHNGLDSPTAVSLTGTGVAPVISLSPPELQFGQQPVGTTSPPQAVALANSGDAPLNILGIEATGDFAQTNNCPGSVAAGGQCAISVTFTPGVAGSHTGAVAITHNPLSESFTLGLSGMGTDFSISATPASATVSAGETATYSLTLNPMAGFSGQVSLDCSGAPKAAACTVAPEEVSVNGSGSATAAVTIKTTASSLAPTTGSRPDDFMPSAPVVLRMLWLFILTSLALAGWRNPKRRARLGLGGVLLSAALWIACGGGGSASAPAPKQGTPPGNYTLTVTATSEGITRSATVTLRVN